MSQNTVSFPDAPVRLPLLKFSYATVSNESVMPIPWIHLSSKTGLFAIFESTESTLDDGQIHVRKRFKVTNDPEIMEELDLDVLSIEAHRSMNTPPKSLVEAQLPNVTIIVQPPNIAIKYPLTNGQIRRFQVRFSSKENYYEAMKNLARANVPTVEAGAFPTSKPPPPAAQPVSNLLPSDSVSNIGLPYAVASRRRAEIHHEASAHNPRPSIVSSTVLPASPHRQQPPTPGVSSLTTLPVPRLQTTNAKDPGSHAYPSALGSNASTTLVADAVDEPLDDREKLSHGNLPAEPLEAEEFGLSLPPKRELPFSKPKSKADQNGPSNDAENPPVSQTSVENDLSEDRLPPSQAQKSSKRPAIRNSTVKQPPAKRSRATRRSKANTKDSAEMVVPSVEEILAQPNKVVDRRVTRSASIIARDAISKDDPKRQERPPPKVQPLSKKVHITRSTSILHTEGQPSLEVPETCTSTEVDAAVPCTPAYQMIQADTPLSPGLVEQSSAAKHVITGQA